MHIHPRLGMAPLLLLLVGAASEPTVSGVEGRWEGIIFTRPAQFEVDMTLETAREREGWVGHLSVPVQGIDHRRLDELKVDGPQVSFVLKDPSGDSTFTGFLAQDGNTISGDLSEAGQTYLCRFSRASGNTTRTIPAVQELGADGAELRRLFNAEKARPRLLMIFSPSCLECKVSSLVVQRYLLTGNALPDLRVFVVWEPAQGHDTAEGRFGAIRAASLLNDDTRVSQFWSSNRFAGTAFKDQLGFSSPAWDVFLLFAPGQEWVAEAPRPAFSMNNRSHDPARRLEAKVLAAKVKEMSIVMP
jgi:hypothetical protein